MGKLFAIEFFKFTCCRSSRKKGNVFASSTCMYRWLTFPHIWFLLIFRSMRNLTCWTDIKMSCRSSGTRDGNTCNWVKKRRRLFHFPPPPNSRPLSSSFASLSFSQTVQKIGCNRQLRLNNLRLWLTVLEVMQFARDAHMAEGWMIAQEPYLKNENLGVSDFLFLFVSFVWSFFGSTKNS